MDSPEFLNWKEGELQRYLKGTPWKVYQTDKGKPYYYQKLTKVTQWTKPEDIRAFEDTLSLENFRMQTKVVSNANDVSKVVKTLTKEELEQLLERRDSILEPKAATTARALNDEHQVSKEQIISKFVSSYSGYPAMTRMLVEWIKLANILQEAPSTKNDSASSSGISSTSSNSVLSGASKAKVDYFGSDAFGDEIMAPYLSELIKLRFNRKAADALVTTPAAEPKTSNTSSSNNRTSSTLPVLPRFVHTLAQNALYKETFEELYKLQEQSTLLKAVHSGAYTTTAPTSTADTKIVSCTTDAWIAPEQVFASFCLEVDLMNKVGDSLKNFVDCLVSGDTVRSLTIQEQVLNLVRSSSEAVKYFTLQLVRHCEQDARKTPRTQARRSTSGVSAAGDNKSDGNINIVAAPLAEGESRKRPREGDEVEEEGEDSGASDVKRVRSCNDPHDRLLSALATLYDAILHAESSTITTGPPAATTSALHQGYSSSAAGDFNSMLRKTVEKMLRAQDATSEDVEQLYSLYFRPSTTQPSGYEMVPNPPSTSYLLHPAVQQILVSVLVRKLTDKTEASRDNGERGRHVCRLLGLAADAVVCSGTVGACLDKAVHDAVERLEETVALCGDLQDTFYGVMDESKCACLTSLAQSCSVCARYIVAWATHHTADSANKSNVDFVSVLPVMCGWMDVAAERHPVLLLSCLEAVKAVLSTASSILQAGKHEDAAKVSVLTGLVDAAQRRGLELCVRLIASGYSKHTLAYLIRLVEQLDVEMVRVLLHALLAVENLTSIFCTATPASLLVQLFCTDSSLRALRSQHFDRTDVDKLSMLVQHINAFDALGEETKGHCADLLALCNR